MATVLDVREAVATVVPDAISVVDVTQRHAFEAAQIHARNYHRTRSRLSLADCLVIALGSPELDTVAPADGPLLRAARAEGREIMVLPDSQGKFASIAT